MHLAEEAAMSMELSVSMSISWKDMTRKKQLLSENEYGIGGGSGGLPGNDDSHNEHDGKGIRLEKGSYGNPYAKVLLNWNVVENGLGS